MMVLETMVSVGIVVIQVAVRVMKMVVKARDVNHCGDGDGVDFKFMYIAWRR